MSDEAGESAPLADYETHVPPCVTTGHDSDPNKEKNDYPFVMDNPFNQARSAG